MDRTTLNAQQWQNLQDLMDKPPEENKTLKELMSKKHDVEVELEFYYKDCTPDCKVYVEILIDNEKAKFSTIALHGHGPSFCVEKMTISEFNTWRNEFIADAFEFDSSKEEFGYALSQAKPFLDLFYKD